jgi:hypothetical protein
MYTHEKQVEIQTPKHRDKISRSITLPPSVLSPSSILIFISLCFHSRKEKFGASLKIVVTSIFPPVLKLGKPEIA